MRIPGKNWEYAIRTKFPDSSDKPSIVSDPVTFKTPWVSAVDGLVEVGTTGEPVAQVRVCGQLLRKRSEVFSTADFYGTSREETNVGAYMYSWHSNQMDLVKRSSAFHVTDQFFETSSQLDYGEYVKIVLRTFSSISNVRVCFLRSSALLDVRVLDFDDPNDRGDTGSKCVLKRSDADNSIIYDSVQSSTCQTFVCAGTSVSTYVGQVVTVKFLDEENSVSSGIVNNILDREIFTDLNVNGPGGLGKCQGKCDSDSDCASGLKCWQRNGYERIPGCSGRGTRNWDYCTDSEYFKSLVDLNSNGNGNGGLGMCQGNCNQDSDCASGLKCFFRNGYVSVPGCLGSGQSGWDYCVDEKFLTRKVKGNGPKRLCEGKCTSDSDCASGLKCFKRDGFAPVPGCWGGHIKGLGLLCSR